jgi:hypothetical protein
LVTGKDNFAEGAIKKRSVGAVNIVFYNRIKRPEYSLDFVLI